ncbi:MAG: PilZ domain-containing protein [Candidatus Omnitrophica bacterium]|nr:PilZ domain-containing protein [Candidatus Omnitrophota bacterium]MBU0878718.1 PilZ domain-containing protein [Candidatus Omnitrophota bacterium]MBU0896789.1 PilZ domain-containing protein [Candidatus Omnitrophota bacterium]MBU1134152.1 PilZ domain-containing protein [Candidatus Omnitrophota bacterium]MBU1809987.1 PilZ domain-containing protein [Candidatus Omnitrophota bacterium]
MEKTIFKEKRLYQRHPCFLTGDFSSSHDNSGKVECHDVSIFGLGLTADSDLSMGAILRINLITKKQVPFTLEGKVCWCNEQEGDWRAGVVLDKPFLYPLEIVQ